MGTGKGKKSAKSKKAGPPPRFGWQDQQEAESKADFAKCLAKLGWNVMQPEKDLGEDYLVQIYDDGVSSGLSFYVQLKSIKGAEKRKSKRAPDELRYPLEVKDIEHWEVQSPPVVLFVWDLDKQAGYWETIARIVEVLEKKGKEWREKNSVTVRVPVANGTDDEGMRRLRRRICEQITPFVPKGPGIKAVFSFPNTSDGIAARKSLVMALDAGDATTIDGKFIASLQYPAWHRRLYGDARGTPSQLTIAPKPHALSIFVRIEVHSQKGSASMPYVELLVTKQGRKQMMLSNEHQNRSIIFELFGDDESGAELTMRWVRWGNTIQEARETVAFYRVTENVVGRLCMFLEQGGQKILDVPCPARQTPKLEEFNDVLEKLAFIEPYVSKYGPIAFNDSISADDARLIAVLYEICKNGQVTIRKPFQWVVTPETDEIKGGVAPSIVEHVTGRMKLLGLEIPLGRIRREICDSARIASALRAGIERARLTGEAVPIRVDDVDAIEFFLDWPPPRDRLQDLAATQSGYFTLTQAFEAGFTSAEQLQIHERVERCADGVYRFVLYPASDHEDLVITWLQTEKQGVFSHDTALALHELSDILPVRQHITVPPGWKPIEGMALSANTVVHEGTVADAEKSWMGPVPFTKPLRTLVDCIDDVLPPDILEQALADAYARGMLSPVELHSLQARKAKSA
jgi:hypothetical protein